MTILHLLCISAVGKCHKLMSKTYSKNWNICIEKLLYLSYCDFTLLWISRTICKHDSVRSVCNDLLSRCLCRIYCDLAASSKERLDDVLFNTEIDDRNLESVTRIEHFLLTCYIENNMSHLPCLNTLHALIKIIILISSDHTSHGTIFSEDLGKCSGIDSFYTSYIILNKKFVYGHLASEIARSLAELSNNES